jgi:hypothetical protein
MNQLVKENDRPFPVISRLEHFFLKISDNTDSEVRIEETQPDT